MSDNVRQRSLVHATVTLEPGEWYIIQVTGEDPKFARLEGWNGERPVFDVFGSAAQERADAVILRWVPDPFAVGEGDPRPS